MMAEKTKKRVTADIILLPKQLRAEWMDVMALDASLPDNAFRVGCVIGSHFNKYRGDAYPSIQTLAKVMGASERTVWAGVKELERRGYLIVKRRELGTIVRKRKDGTESEVRLAGGKGVSNTYQPAFERSQIFATTIGSKLAERCDLYWSQSSQKSVPKVATDCDPTLNLPSEGNPSRAQGPSSPDGLGPFGTLISKRIGDAAYRAWFAKAAIAAETPDSVTLSVDSTFRRDHITAQFGPQILDCCRAVMPTVLRVDVVVREAA